MIKFKFKKSARVNAGLLSGAAFIAMAIHSWGLHVSTALIFLAISLGFLLGIVCLAAFVAFLIKLARGSPDR